MDHARLLRVAVDEARAGLGEGGIPIGSALFDASGAVLGSGHNQRVQRDDAAPSRPRDRFKRAGVGATA